MWDHLNLDMLIRNIVVSLIAGVVAFADPASAFEWQEQTHEDTKIRLRLDKPWAAPDRGEYWHAWADSFKQEFYAAEWQSGDYPRVGINLTRLAPGYIWKRVSRKITKKNLIFWKFLKDKGVSEIKEIKCGAETCVIFKSENTYSCASFFYARGILSATLGDEGTDLVRGYYCPGSVAEISVDDLNAIINSVKIKKN